jgi:hypothetical protein
VYVLFPVDPIEFKSKVAIELPRFTPETPKFHCEVIPLGVVPVLDDTNPNAASSISAEFVAETELAVNGAVALAEEFVLDTSTGLDAAIARRVMMPPCGLLATPLVPKSNAQLVSPDCQ